MQDRWYLRTGLRTTDLDSLVSIYMRPLPRWSFPKGGALTIVEVEGTVYYIQSNKHNWGGSDG